MFTTTFLLSSVVCTLGFTNAEIHHNWMTQDRRAVNYFPQIRQQSNDSKVDNTGFQYYNTRPIYRYDYRLNEKNHLNRHYNHKFQGNHVSPYTTGIYKSYGRGTATVPKLGATISISNSHSQRNVHKGTITARVKTPIISYTGTTPRIVTRNKRYCRGCPQNRAVVASRGNIHVVLPEPCPNLRWMRISGPNPGMLISEGIHSLIGRLGYRGKICQYEYEVIVRHCEKFIVEHGNTNCTIDDAWGSFCTITCKDGYELIGSSVLECVDDLNWSNKPPICKKKRGCPLPQTPDNEKIWCQVPDESDLTENNLPADSYCRFKSDGKQRFITCVDGYWVNKPGNGKRNHRAVKRKKSKKIDNGKLNWKKE